MMRQLLICVFGLLFVLPAFATLPQSAINAGYTEVEYIQSNGTQYINTGITSNGIGLKSEVKLQLTTDSTAVQAIVGRNAGSGYELGFTSGARIFTYHYTDQAVRQDINYNTSTIYTIISEMTENSITQSVNGVAAPSYSGVLDTSSSYPQSAEISLFRHNFKYPVSAKVYYIKLWNNGSLERDFVPARYGNTVGLYDVKNNRFYESAASGTNFEAGPAVCNGTLTTYATATGSFSQNPSPTPSAPITPTFYTQGNMVLRAVGTGADTVADSYNATTGKITRNVGYVTFNGTENWKAYGSNYPGLFYLDSAVPDNKLGVSSFVILSNRFVGTDDPGVTVNGTLRFQQESETHTVTTHRLYIKNTAFTTASDFKTWLSSNSVTVWYPLAETYTEDWAAWQCDAGCGNLFDKSMFYPNVGETLTYRTFDIPNGTYTMWSPDFPIGTGGIKNVFVFAGQVTSGASSSTNGVCSGTPRTITVTNGKYTVAYRSTVATNTANPANYNWMLEQGETPTTYCLFMGPIKIATVKYNTARFSPVITALNGAIDTIKTVVSNTIAQTTAIGNLQSAKQTRPADTACPQYRQCLLVEDSSGVPHWYEIMDPFYNLFSAVIAENVSTTALSAQSAVPNIYTQLDFLTSDNGGAVINTGITFDPSQNFSIVGRFINPDTDKRKVIIGNYNNGSGSGYYYNLEGYTAGKLRHYMFSGALDHSVVSVPANTVVDYSTYYNATAHTLTDYITYNGQTVTDEFTATAPSSVTGSGVLLMFRDARTSGVTVNPISIGNTAIYKNDVLVGNFIPVRRNSDSTLGMYDTVTGDFKTTAAGTFTAGNPVPNQQAVWTADFAANSPLDVRYRVFGSAICNATSGSTNTAATSAQMSANNWTASGNYCWCHIDKVNDSSGNIGNSNGNIWVWVAVPSGATCSGGCPGACATAVGTGTNTAFRRAITGM